MELNNFKKPHFDLKQYHTIFIEMGIIGSLLIFILATNVRIEPKEQNDLPLVTNQEVIKMKDVVKTKQKDQPPPPPRPQAPIAVPNSAIIEDEIPDINAEFQMDQPLEIPEPPKSIEQKGDNEGEDFFVAVEQMPQLIGSLADLQGMIRYPETARIAGIEGRVVVQFIINTKGEVENPKVIRGIGGGCDKEALRVVKQAKFKPGRQRGKPVRVQFSLPIMFILKRN